MKDAADNRTVDAFGDAPVTKQFRDTRNRRPAVADEKAQLALILGSLINKVPTGVSNGSVNQVHAWKAVRDKAAKVAKRPNASVAELNSAISSMSVFK